MTSRTYEERMDAGVRMLTTVGMRGILYQVVDTDGTIAMERFEPYQNPQRVTGTGWRAKFTRTVGKLQSRAVTAARSQMEFAERLNYQRRSA